MKVILIPGTQSDPGPKIIIESNTKFTTVESFERWLKVQQVALAWLKKELAK
jgi:hypothetical protein